jgi:hypothetical protein
MIWAAMAIAALVLVIFLARRKQHSDGAPVGAAERPRTRDRKDPVIAHQLVGKDYVPMSKADIERLFGEENADAPSLATLAKKAKKCAAQFVDAPDDEISRYREAAARARVLADGIQAKIDGLFFDPENGVDRYQKLMDDLDDAESILSSAVEEILQNRKDREAGDIPINLQKKPAKKNKTPTPRKQK